jgi:inosine-uridine nucleoside N-ribohydrolase
MPIRSLGRKEWFRLPQKVLIDADPGVGDAIAIALAILDPEIDIVGITATGGQVSGRQASRNLHAIVDSLDPPKWPRLGSSDAPTAAIPPSTVSGSFAPEALNGSTGLGSHLSNIAELHHPRDAAKLMIELVRDQPNEITLLTLGPLTNVEVASERAPEFLGLLNSLVCLGGSVEVGGDVTPASEFNMFAAPDAARNVLRSAATKTLIPLDISQSAVMTFDQFDRLPDSESSSLCRLLSNLVPFALRASHQHLGLEGLRLPEVVALAAISQPRFFERDSMAVDVETHGKLTRGMTVFDRRGIQQWQTNIDVLVDVDTQGVLDYFADIVRCSVG